MAPPTLSHGLTDRLALVCRSLDGGGAEGVMIALASELSAKGVLVTLVLLCKGTIPVLQAPSFEVVELGAPSLARAAAPFVRWLRAARPRAVLATLVGPNALAVSAARLLPCPPRIVVREANTLSVALQFRSRASRIAAGLVARATYPRADAIVAVSQQAGDDLARFVGVDRSRITVIPNPAVTRDLEARMSEPVAHRWLQPRTAPIIVAAGRLVPKKGFGVLVDAFARVRSERVVRLVILGEGEERGALEARISRLGLRADVELAGFVENPFAWFARADLFVLSSYAEGMPNALLQAMACGCPVVATDCPSGPREILEGGRWGGMVSPGDPGALARAILTALKMPIATRKRASDFEIGPIAEAYLRVLARARLGA